MSGTRSPAQFFAQPFDRHIGDGALRVHPFDRGREEELNSYFLQQGAIAFERSWIFQEIFIGSELPGIHEDRNRDWSSDVCSSDQIGRASGRTTVHNPRKR